MATHDSVEIARPAPDSSALFDVSAVVPHERGSVAVPPEPVGGAGSDDTTPVVVYAS